MDLNALRFALKANIPIAIEGPPGCGKTACVKGVAEEIGFQVVETVVATSDPVEFAGFPVPTKVKYDNGDIETVIRRLADSFVSRLEENDGKVIWFLDEYTNGAPSVRAAVLKGIDERRIGDFKFPREMRVVLAYNNPEYAVNGYELTPPEVSRFAMVEYKFDPIKWSEEFPSYWGHTPDPGTIEIDPAVFAERRGLISAFIRSRSELAFKFHKKSEEYSTPFPCPRQWERVARLLSVAPNPIAVLTFIEGLVGKEAAHQFVSWYKLVNLPDPAEVLNNPEMWKVPEKVDILFAALSSIVAYAVSKMGKDQTMWKKIFRVIGRVADSDQPDIAAAFIRQIKAVEPRGATIPPEILKFNSIMLKAGI